MLHFKAPARRVHRDFITAEWGKFVRHLEVGDDQYAVRQVDIFRPGDVLRYDRAHWWDDYGMLLGLRFSRKGKWAAAFPGAEVIEAAEVERVWRAALQSPLWEKQLARSRRPMGCNAALPPRDIEAAVGLGSPPTHRMAPPSTIGCNGAGVVRIAHGDT